MKLAPVSSLLLCALPLLTACGSAVGESADTAESKVGVAAEALVAVTPAPLAGGDYGSMVIRADETVVAFGYDIHGQLGDGGNSDQKSPQPVPGLTKIKAVSAGLTNYSMAVDGDGALYSWGSNIWGQLGLGMPGNGDVSAPTKVTFPAGVLIKAVAAANIHPIALGDDGTVWSWGFNGDGQLGNGSFGGNTTSPSRVQVRLSTGELTPLTGVKAIAGGAGHGLALKEDKTVWSWGSNSHGQLGDGTIDDECTAHAIAGLTNIKAIAAGRHHALALTEGGAVFAWGENERGQLGDESIVERRAPVSVHGLSGVTIKALAASFESSFALKDDGTLVAWGLNGNGQLGDESSTERPRRLSIF